MMIVHITNDSGVKTLCGEKGKTITYTIDAFLQTKGNHEREGFCPNCVYALWVSRIQKRIDELEKAIAESIRIYPEDNFYERNHLGIRINELKGLLK